MSDIYCPECDAENPSSEDICIQCGFPLDDLEASPPPVPSSTCPGCGKDVGDDMKFCDGCGANLQVAAAAPAPPPVPEPEPVPVAAAADPAPIADPDPSPIAPPPPPVTANPDQNYKFSVIEGFSLGKEYLLYKDEMVLGRIDKEGGIFPDIDLEDQDDGYVSRRHAIARVNQGQVSIEDLGGENGTTVDNQPIPPQKPFDIQPGQVVRIGKVGLILKAHKN